MDSSDDDEVTALQVASANGHEHLVHLLIMKGATIDKANSAGWTPLLQAARHGHSHIVALLLQNQADINARTNLGVNAMLLAARGGHLQTCRLLEDCRIDQSFPNSAVDGSNCEFTTAMVAAFHGHDNIVRHLLDRGNDVNYRTPTLGTSSLMFAAMNGHMTTAQILIERGADPNLSNINDDTALAIAVMSECREVQAYLDRKTTKKTRTAYQDIRPSIINAAKNGNLQQVSDILAADRTECDVCSTQDGATPLMFAAMGGHLEIAKLLVDNGCDVNKQDFISGWTALMQATFHGKLAMAKYLIGVGADVCIPAKNGCSVFDLVTFIENVDTELCRLIASKALMKQSHVDHMSKKTRVIRNDSGSTIELLSMDSGLEEIPRSGLKAWWNRMSNRFRNLKLGRTFTLDTIGRSSSVEETNVSITNHSPNISNFQNLNQKKSTESLFTTKKSDRGINVNSTEAKLAANRNNGTTLLSLGMLSTSSSNPLNNTIKPVSPFSSPAPVQTNGHKMPPISLKKSVVNRLGSTPALDGLTSSVHGFTGRSTLSLMANGNPNRMPIRSARRPIRPLYSTASTEISPSASSEASVLNNGMSSAKSKVASSASSSTGTLTAGSGGDSVSVKPTEVAVSDNKSSSQLTFCDDRWSNTKHREEFGKKSKKSPFMKSFVPSESSMLNQSSASKVSKMVTSADSPQKCIPLTLGSLAPPLDTSTPDDIGRVLQQLSLEHYHAIFEEQEVDMEAFLSLTDDDLVELGISNDESRRQILATVGELNLNKDRERQHYQQAISHFNSTLRSATHFDAANSRMLNFNKWNEDGTVEQP